MSTESVMLSTHLILCCPLLLLLQSCPASGSFPMSQFFASGGQIWSFSISLSNEYSGLISFRIDYFDLLAVQGTLKSLLQHHSTKASVLRCSAFSTVLLLHRYVTTGKTIAWTIQMFVSKVISLLFNTLFRFVIAFLPRSEHLLILWHSLFLFQFKYSSKYLWERPREE